MTEFDYITAHRDLVTPLFYDLTKNHPEMVTLLRLVILEASDIHQDLDLSLPWPKPEDGFEEMRKLFGWAGAEMPDVLAAASHIIYFYGHLAPSGKQKECFQDSGTYWKFSKYADQVLAEALGISRDDDTKRLALKVSEGRLILTFSNEHNFMREVVGPATQKAVDAVRASLGTPAFFTPKCASKSHRVCDADADKFTEQVKLVRELGLLTGTVHEKLEHMGASYTVDKLPPQPQSAATVQAYIESTLDQARRALKLHAKEYRESTLLPLCKKHKVTYRLSEIQRPLLVDSDGIDLDLDDCAERFPDLVEQYEILDHWAMPLDSETTSETHCEFGLYVAPITREDLQ